MLRKVWQHDLTLFLTFRAAFGPMQFLIIAVVLAIFLGNMGIFLERSTAFLCLSVWLSLCLQSARLKDARLPRWLSLLSLFVPCLIAVMMPQAFALWADLAPKSLAQLVSFEWKYLIPVMRMTADNLLLWIWVVLYFLFLLFIPSRLQSDKRPA